MKKDTTDYLIFIGGMVFFLFGVFKVFFGIINFIYHNKEPSIDFFKYFMSPDKSTAAILYEIIITIFGIYSIIKGLYYLKVITNKDIISVIEHKKMTLILYLIFGVFLTSLFTFISYFPEQSKKIIDSDQKYNATYKFAGITTGLIFLITLITLLIRYNYDNFDNNYYILTFLIALMIIFGACALTIMIKYGKDFTTEYLTFFAIALER